MREFFYKIYASDGTYIKTITDVVDRYPSFSWDVNGGLGACTLTFARSWASYRSGEDLQMGNQLEIWVKKSSGSVEKIYCGMLNRVSLERNAGKEAVKGEFIGYVFEFSKRIFEDVDGDTALQMYSDEPAEAIKDILDLCAGKISYTGGSIGTTGITATIIFNGQTILDALKHVLKFVPNSWFFFVDATNTLFFKEKTTDDTPDHLLVIDGTIAKLTASVRMDSMVNDVILLGGTPEGGSQIYKRKQDAGSIADYGKRTAVVQDGRIFDETTLDYILDSNMMPFPESEWSLEILASQYDIESFSPGDLVRIKNIEFGSDPSLWGDFVWGDDYWGSNPNDPFAENMIITRIDYRGDRVTLTASSQVPNVAKDMENLKRNFELFATKGAPLNQTV